MQYTESYILGIKEGRSLLTSNPDFTVQDMKECAETCKRLIPQYSQPMKDVFKGERDFWLNQIKMKEKQNA
jgi:hypothetical protein